MQWSSKGSIFARPVYVAVIDVVCDADFLELVRNSLLVRMQCAGFLWRALPRCGAMTLARASAFSRR